MIVPYLAVPVNEIVIDVALTKVAVSTVKPVVPRLIVNSDGDVEVSKLLPVMVMLGFVAPFAIVLDVEIEGEPTTPVPAK